MSDHYRGGRCVFLGKRQELSRQTATDVAIECHKVHGPEAVKDREQQQWVFGRLTQRFSLFDLQTRPLHRRLGFRRCITFNVKNEFMSATCNLICSRRKAGVASKSQFVRAHE